MKVETSDKSGYVEPKAGLTQGVIRSIIDVGTSEGKFGKKREIVIVLALPKQTHTHDVAIGPEMLTISKWFSLSLNKKANLRAFIEGAVGELPEGEEYDIMSLLGLNVMVHITEKTKDNGEKTMNIANVSPLMDGVDAVQVETSKFDLDEYDKAEFDALGEKMQERIKKCDEFTSLPF